MKTLVRLWESDAKIFCVFKDPSPEVCRRTHLHDDDDLTIATAVVCHASSSVLRLFDFTPLYLGRRAPPTAAAPPPDCSNQLDLTA
jgi:hypothetical protein